MHNVLAQIAALTEPEVDDDQYRQQVQGQVEAAVAAANHAITLMDELHAAFDDLARAARAARRALDSIPRYDVEDPDAADARVINPARHLNLPPVVLRVVMPSDENYKEERAMVDAARGALTRFRDNARDDFTTAAATWDNDDNGQHADSFTAADLGDRTEVND